MSATTTKSFRPPYAELGIFARTFVAVAAALLAFSLVACITIFSMLAYWIATSKAVDFSIAYRVTGLSAGTIALAAGVIWNIWAGIYRIQHPVLQQD